MGLFDFLKSKPDQPAPQASGGVDIAKITNPAELDDFLRNGDGIVTDSGEAVNTRTALKVAAAYRCVEITSDIAATAPINIKDKETFAKRSVEDDLVYLLNDTPNARMSSYTLRKAMDMHRQLRGNGYARIVRGFRRRPVALEFMDSRAVQVRERQNRSIEYQYTRTNGTSFVLEQEDVLHVMGPSENGIVGMSILEAARNQIGYSLATEKHGSSLFKNGTNIGDILSTDKALGPEEVEFLRSSLEEYRGAENSHKTLILQGGLKHDKIGMTQADAEFVLSRKLGIIELCMFWGVPPHIVGYTENQTSYGQGVEHQGIAFVNYKVNGIYSAWESAIKRALLPDSRREMVEMDDSKLLRGDTKSRWESHKIAREVGAFNANDILMAEGKPPREGGDEYWTQPNLAKGASNEPVKTPKD